MEGSFRLSLFLHLRVVFVNLVKKACSIFAERTKQLIQQTELQLLT